MYNFTWFFRYDIFEVIPFDVCCIALFVNGIITKHRECVFEKNGEQKYIVVVDKKEQHSGKFGTFGIIYYYSEDKPENKCEMFGNLELYSVGSIFSVLSYSNEIMLVSKVDDEELIKTVKNKVLYNEMED